MRALTFSLAAALAAAPFAAGPASAAEVSITATNPVVELSIYEEVEVEPDIVTIGAGVTTQAPTAVEALRRNSAEMRRVIDLLKALGIQSRDIQTSRIGLNAQYDYNRTTQQQVFRAYQATNRVSVKLREIQRAGEVLDALVSAGATDIFGPNFSIEDDTEAKAVARERALERGKAQAEQYARFAGYSGVRLLQVAEAIRGPGGPIARDQIMVTAARAEAAAPPPPIEPGLVGTGVNLQLTFEMVR
ncbi:SIMPL domain-containing protein [Erythrobacter litoralis]|uniref:Outer membrane protein n=1 Tax=Erythrobacter litoralis (strain HTCC2594) TaxID=314225 RepID=Q2NBX2_ERYLH|nr:SIMPL domain-containing protein [Erythrobacter litoralis]ABC62819.1 outer membrane protein [Erythrobacter litoralis HTCC2594]